MKPNKHKKEEKQKQSQKQGRNSLNGDAPLSNLVYKRCPACNTAVALNANHCSSCPHSFSTNFASNQTQAFPIHANAPAFDTALKQRKKTQNIILGCSGCVIVPFVLILLQTIFGQNSHRQYYAPGPRTLAFYSRASTYRSFTSYIANSDLGEPTRIYPTTYRGVNYIFWDYDCVDGKVILTISPRLKTVEQVDCEGNEKPD